MRKLIRDRNLHDIAAAIRTKNGSNGTYKPREMADAIRALPSPSTLISKTITQNGSYSPQSENADGFSSVTVNVGRNLVRKDITRNGSFSAASDHVDGYSSVSVNVPNSYSALDEGKVVSSGTLTPQTSLSVTQNGTFDTTRNNQVTVNVSGASNTLVSKTITANGTYLPADDNADGFNWVNVAVPGGFEASDEGKVVLNGALMPQTSLSVTANGTYDTTDKNSVAVNVGGGSSTILSGYGAPSSSLGSNGNLYLELENGTDNAVLLHFDGDTITDTAGNTTWTTFGNATISSAQSRFGGSSLFLNGGHVDSAATSLVGLLDHDFTIDCWIYPTSSSRQEIICGGDYRWDIQFRFGTDSVNCYLGTNGSSWSNAIIDSNNGDGKGSISVNTNEWTHVAFVRNGTNIRLYVNGARAYEKTADQGASVYYATGDSFRIGKHKNGSIPFYGYIDEVRVLNGTAAWTDEFTPPTAPYVLDGAPLIKSVWAKVNGTWVEHLEGLSPDDISGV